MAAPQVFLVLKVFEVGVIKAPFPNFSVKETIHFAEIIVRFFESLI